MTLAVSSFLDMPRLESQNELLNLAWTVDEQELLSANLRGFVSCLLEDELQRDLPHINSYLLHDPWGEDILRSAVAALSSDQHRFVESAIIEALFVFRGTQRTLLNITTSLVTSPRVKNSVLWSNEPVKSKI